VTETMTIKFEAVSNTPLAGAHNAYLVLFTIDNEVPPGSKFRVTNLVGSISARSAPLRTPRTGCGNDLRCACCYFVCACLL
jgi:hypothetical protein